MPLASCFLLLASSLWLLTSSFWLPALAHPASRIPHQESSTLTGGEHDLDLQGKKISRLEIYVSEKLATDQNDELYRAIGIRAGQPLALAEIRKAILSLYESGRASNVIVEADETADGVIVRFRLTPQPRIGRVTFQGVDSEIQSQLIARLGEIDPGARLTQGLLARAADEIAEFYQGLGFFDCEVAPVVSLEEDGRMADIVFRVTPGQPARIGELQLVGDLKLDRRDVLSRLESKPGVLYNSLRLQDDLRRLRELHLARGYLSPQIGLARIQRDADANSIKIEIPANSGPLVEVNVEGMKISADLKRQLLPVLRQGGLDDLTLEEGRLNLLDYVQREGYFFAEVKVERFEQDDKVKIVYAVEQGRKYNLREIKIEGSTNVTVERLAGKLGSVTGGFKRRGLTSRELMELDKRVIVGFLNELGFRRARIRESRLAVRLNREDLIIIYVVDEGPRVTVGEITFDGNRTFTEDELKKQIGFAVGDAFAEVRINEASTRIASSYAENGYAEAQVKSEATEIGNNQVRVLFRIREGNKLTVGQIAIKGKRTTTDQAIRRYLTVREGDLLKRDELSNSEENLYASGAFRRVSITAAKVGIGSEFENIRSVIVELDEAPRHQVTYGFGYRTDDGPRGIGEISNLNLFGQLRTGSVRVRGSRREQVGQISYTDPKPFGRDLPSLISILFQRQEEVAFDASRFTALAQLEKRLNEKTYLFLRYNFSNVIITNVTQPEELRREDTTVQLGRLSASFLRDLRDSPFDPTSGAYTTLDLSVVARSLGGSENFLRFFGEHQRIYKLGEKSETVFATDMRLGLAWPFGRSFAVPISERFFAGGSTTLRGFGFEQAGPRVLDTDRPGQTRPFGGNAVAVLNAELRFPILRSFKLGGAVFYDTGNVFSRVGDFNFQGFSHTLGFGLRIKTPLGPLRLDFGVLVKREPGVPRTQFHATFGNPF